MKLKTRIRFVYHDRKIKVFPVTEDELKFKNSFHAGFLWGAITIIVGALIGKIL